MRKFANEKMRELILDNNKQVVDLFFYLFNWHI